jgi:hypothetical protein
MGKGSAPRPIPNREEFESNWEKTFGKKKEAKKTEDKPVVYFAGVAKFDDEYFPGHTVAHLYALKHPILGDGVVRTSSVLKKHEDGSFETVNTVYKPAQGDLFQ